MGDEFNPDWEIVPYDLNKKPKEDPDAYAHVPANTERQLEAMPSRQRSSTESYYAQPVLTAPSRPLLLKGPSAKQEAIIKVPAGTRVLPPVGYFKRKQKNPQAHGYRCSFHPGVFQSIDFPQGT